MLPKKNRLKKEEVEFIFKKGKTYKKGFLLLKIIEDKKELASLFSVVVPKKVSKKAVERNKIKRKIRESLRKKLDKIKPGIKGLFIALPGAKEKNYKEIEKNIDELIAFSKINKNKI